MSDAFAEKKVVVGFDAYIDIVGRPIKNRDSGGAVSLYDNINDLGDFVKSRAGKSGTVQLTECAKRAGGNAPIFGRALGGMGAGVTCIGSFGMPVPEPTFASVAEHCELVTMGEPALCMALEFDDGKLMLGMNETLSVIDFEHMCRAVTLERFKDIYAGCDLAGFFNWSELAHGTALWNDMLTHVMPAMGEGTWAFFDLSDTASRSVHELREALQVIRAFSVRHRVVLSLNDNEYAGTCTALGLSGEDTVRAGRRIRDVLNLDMLLLHFMGHAHAFTAHEAHSVKTVHIANPITTTGAGDNFNAGAAAGLLMSLPIEETLVCAAMSASFYVSMGKGCTLEELKVFAERNHVKIGLDIG